MSKWSYIKQACPDHNSYIYAWISKIILHSCYPQRGEVLFETFLGRLKVKVTGVK